MQMHTHNSISNIVQNAGLITCRIRGVSSAGGGTYPKVNLPIGYPVARKMRRKMAAAVDLEIA
jgi:hypothetical protein